MYRINFKHVLLIVIVIIAFILILMFGMPVYRVWQQEMRGKAEFAQAEQNRKIKVEEARANLEAEKLNALAEVERARGAAEAIKIENGTLTDRYIQYLWVRNQNNLSDKTVIYIPTEGNLPIMEAGRFLKNNINK
jgi:FtsZ-interacting cell division protein ZipA